MTKIILLFTFFLPLFAVGQQNTYEWGDGMTIYTGRFDTARFTIEEIDTIHNFLYLIGGDLPDGPQWNIEALDTATTTSLDQSYERAKGVLERIKLPEGEFWDSLQKFRLRELDQRYTNKRLYILGFKNPALLLDYYTDSCAPIINALNGESSELLAAWHLLNERQKANNGSPAIVEREYQAQLKSPQRVLHARVELMTFGWWNCANHSVSHYENFSEIEEEFQKLFEHVEVLEFLGEDDY